MNLKFLLVCAVLPLSAMPAISAQTQAPSAQPNIAGQINGVFPEPAPLDFADHTGFVSLFDGKTLDGWDGEPGVWSVEDGPSLASPHRSTALAILSLSTAT